MMYFVRFFQLGRTENINPVSKDSKDFVLKMESPTATNEERVAALRRAIKYQVSAVVYGQAVRQWKVSDRWSFVWESEG